MRILLANPPAVTIFSRLGLNLPPLGLLSLAAVLERAGHEVEVVDFAVEGDPGKTDFTPYGLVGITSDTSRIQQALQLARLAKEAGAAVVVGGPHAQYRDQEVLASGAVDAVAWGESEETILEVVEALEGERHLAGVVGLSLPGSDGDPEHRVIRTGSRPPVRDLDRLPVPARHLVRREPYRKAQVHGRPVASVSTSRGCPSNCRFCSVPDFVGRRLRYRDTDAVLDEIHQIHSRLGYRAVAFMDDNFTVSPRRAMAIAEGILQRGYDLHLWMFSRPDTIVRNPDMVRLLARAGTRTIFVGIESGSDATLESFGKNYTADAAREAVALLRSEGIETMGAYIIGAPEDDPRTLAELLRFARELDTATAQFSILTPFPGTRLMADLADRITTRDWSRYDGLHLVFRHPAFPGLSLRRWLLRANLSFYFRSPDSVGRLVGFCRTRTRFGLRRAGAGLS